MKASFFKDMDVVITTGAAIALSDEEANGILGRHASKDWGDVPKEDGQANDESYKNGGMLLSSYSIRGMEFWVITDPGWKDTPHKVTTILLPEEY